MPSPAASSVTAGPKRTRLTAMPPAKARDRTHGSARGGRCCQSANLPRRAAVPGAFSQDRVHHYCDGPWLRGGRSPREPLGLGLGLQFGLQFTSIRPSSPEYAHAVQPAARTLMNPGERAPLKRLIRGFGVRVHDGAPVLTWAISYVYEV